MHCAVLGGVLGRRKDVNGPVGNAEQNRDVNKGGAGRGANGNSEPQPPVLQRHSNMQTVRLSKSECSTSADLRENDFKMRNTSLRTCRHDRISKKPKTKGLENSRGLWAGDKKNRFCKNFDPCAQSTHAGA